MNSARQAAAETIHAVCEKGDSLDDALALFGGAVSEQERSLYRALSYGGVRYYLSYQQQLNGRLKKPFKPKDRILTAILVSALYQLDATEQPPYAVVNEAVSLCKHFKRQWATGLVNAVLRGIIRAEGSRPDQNSNEAVRSNYPTWLVEQIQQAWPQHIDTILHASQQKPPLSLRVNSRQLTRDQYLEQLQQAQLDAISCHDAPQGLSLKTAIPVERIPGFDQATVSVQDESAQLAAPLLDLAPGQRVLDGCAAPGGKSLHMLELEPGITLHMLDLAPRLARLHNNLQRAAAPANATVIEGNLLEPTHWWDGEGYERILLDVPCTGTGVMRRHPDIRLRRQAENGLKYSENQLALLQQAWQLLKPGGKLLYTTCSILPIENERCIAGFIEQHDDAKSVALDSHLGIQTAHGRQRLPGLHTGDGFFYALIYKK